MSEAVDWRANVKQAVPFFGVTDIEASLRFYVAGLGFTMTKSWAPEGRIRWCWLKLGDAAVMLQEYWKDGRQGGGPAGPLGQGVSICFMCADAIAIYHEALSRGLEPSQAFCRQQPVGDLAYRSGRVSPRLRKPDRCARGHGLLRTREPALDPRGANP